MQDNSVTEICKGWLKGQPMHHDVQTRLIRISSSIVVTLVSAGVLGLWNLVWHFH
jgi:hypothetical protein